MRQKQKFKSENFMEREHSNTQV